MHFPAIISLTLTLKRRKHIEHIFILCCNCNFFMLKSFLRGARNKLNISHDFFFLKRGLSGHENAINLIETLHTFQSVLHSVGGNISIFLAAKFSRVCHCHICFIHFSITHVKVENRDQLQLLKRIIE